MNKEKLLQKFDDIFNDDIIEATFDSYIDITPDKIKQFITETVIPEAIKSVVPEYSRCKCGEIIDSKDRDYEGYCYCHSCDSYCGRWDDIGKNDCINDIKQKAKELYGIKL